MEVRKALHTDFELVYTLLKEFDSSVEKEQWKKLFEKHWDSSEDYCGFIAVTEGIVVGYIGILFSEREINGKIEKFAGLSSWIVSASYRKDFNPLSLLFKVLSLKDYTITSFTSIPSAAEILCKLGFKELDHSLRMIPKNGASITDTEVYIGDEIGEFLNEKDKRIFMDHRGFHAFHVLIKKQEAYCYLVLKKQEYSANRLFLPRIVFYLHHLTKFFGYPFLLKKKFYGRVHHISNKELFVHTINEAVERIAEKINIEGLLVDERFLNNAPIKKSKKGSWMRSLYKSGSLQPRDIDSLYTELFVLNY